MMAIKKLLFLFATILGLNCYSQTSFVHGYYIDNANQKINCLIKNVDWLHNPTEFKYKLSENSEPKIASIGSVKEFGIEGVSKYLRETINVDRSSEKINDLGTNKNPIFKEEEVFLKVLIEGKASLYLYREGNLRRFFYNKESSKIEQLVFKRFLVPNNSVQFTAPSHNIKTNIQFKHQLWNDLKCSTLKMSDLENLNYEKKDLTNFFINYHKCNDSHFIDYEEKEKEKTKIINLNIRPRLRNSSLAIQNDATRFRDVDFGSKLGFGIGIELEFILPFNNNKWTIIAEPSYQNYKANKTTDVSNVSGGKLISEVMYDFIEASVGLRHYFFLNSDSKVFLNALYIMDFNLKSSLETTRADGSILDSYDFLTRNNMAFGLGYKLHDKYSLEMQYQTRRHVLGKYPFLDSDFNTLSIIFGYSLF